MPKGLNLRGRKPRVVPEGAVYIGGRVKRGGWNLPASKWANPLRICSVPADGSAARGARQGPRMLVRAEALSRRCVVAPGEQLTPYPRDMTTTLRADHLAAADALDDLAARCAFDDRLAGKLKKLAARSRLQGDGALHPEIKAWALMKAGEHKAPGQLYGSPPPRPSSASTVLANLVEETLKKRGVAADDPFRGELAERLAEEARRSASAPRLTDLTWAAPATPTTSPDDVELDLLEDLKRLGQFRLARAARRAGEGFVDLVVATLGDGHGIRVANSRAIEVSRRARSKPHNSGSYFELFNGFGGSSFAH